MEISLAEYIQDKLVNNIKASRTYTGLEIVLMMSEYQRQWLVAKGRVNDDNKSSRD